MTIAGHTELKSTELRRGMVVRTNSVRVLLGAGFHYGDPNFPGAHFHGTVLPESEQNADMDTWNYRWMSRDVKHGWSVQGNDYVSWLVENASLEMLTDADKATPEMRGW